jgi:hypothetical protein
MPEECGYCKPTCVNVFDDYVCVWALHNVRQTRYRVLYTPMMFLLVLNKIRLRNGVLSDKH